ncbi:MAG: GTPase HflX [Tissierellia bacterium]|nr:GTPase HflX [Tissierellia bacterium]
MTKEKVILVYLNIYESDFVVENKIKELRELVRACQAEVVGELVQNASSVNSSFFIGSGKVKEVKEFAQSLEADTIVFNQELTGSQIKNLEDQIDKKIIDRTGLVLDIFARRAKTKEGKLQVQLAQLEYRLPRLKGFRKHLSKEGAGIGTRGPGEQKLEVDRRTVQSEISRIKSHLKKSKEKRLLKSKKRRESKIPIISLIGYSNAGKSTILNVLTKLYSRSHKEEYADDMLFATLDVSARSIILDNSKEVIITDTVGFISDLPTKLVESFKGSLEEIEISDLLVIVVDTSNIDYMLQIQATKKILQDMDLGEKKILYCFNKMDKNEEFSYLPERMPAIYISAKSEDDIKRLAEKITEIVFEDYAYYDLRLSYDMIDSFMKENIKIFDPIYTADGLQARVYLSKQEYMRYKKYIS